MHWLLNQPQMGFTNRISTCRELSIVNQAEKSRCELRNKIAATIQGTKKFNQVMLRVLAKCWIYHQLLWQEERSIQTFMPCLIPDSLSL